MTTDHPRERDPARPEDDTPMSTAADGMRTIDDLEIDGRRVLLRVDFNVPLVPGPAGGPARVADDSRIRAALPTIEELRRKGARLVLISHLGRPKGRDPALSMQPVADRLATLTGTTVPLAPGVVGPHVAELTERLEAGSMLMLENVRFEPGETRGDRRLASSLAELADAYVNDAFGSAHRAHASTEGVAHLLPAAAGRLMEREILALQAIVEGPAQPLVAVLGGAKIHDKIGVLRRFVELADVICIGGAMCFPFLAALGHGVGRSLCPHEDLQLARLALDADAEHGRLQLPCDLLLARWDEEAYISAQVLDGVDVPEDWMGLDIGPRTAQLYAAEIAAAATVFWYGPMGRFELPGFSGGTRSVAQAVAVTSGTTVVAGGETIQTLRSFGIEDRVSHLSSGREATLQFLKDRSLPGVRALLETPAAVP
jgi:phosphoglycerate kinase